MMFFFFFFFSVCIHLRKFDSRYRVCYRVFFYSYYALLSVIIIEFILLHCARHCRYQYPIQDDRDRDCRVSRRRQVALERSVFTVIFRRPCIFETATLHIRFEKRLPIRKRP